MTNAKKFGLTGTQLKLIGVVLMVFDHIHEMFYYAGVPMWFTMLGRLVFPIFIFMAAEGFHYTRSKEKYMLRLLIGFWAVNIFSTVIQRVLPLDSVMLMNNIFGTMFLSTMLMYAVDCFKEKKFLKGILLILIPVIPSVIMLTLMDSMPMVAAYSTMIFPSYLTVEGGPLLVILGMFLYIFREKRILQYACIALVALISTGFMFTDLFIINIQWMMVFAIPLLALYNGEKGKGNKYFFYIFYPAHIYVLYILSYLYTNFMM